MKIETPRLTLRDFTPADGPALHAILGDGEVMAFAEPPYTPAQTQAFLEQFCIARRGGLACVEKATGQLVGYLLFSPLGEQVWELGWFFRRDTWGKGFATEASRALLCHAFQTLSAREVVAETIDTGRAARVLEKLWFRREGAQPVESPAGGEDPAVSIRPSCQGLGTGKIETAPENSSAVSPCLVRFGEGT